MLDAVNLVFVTTRKRLENKRKLLSMFIELKNMLLYFISRAKVGVQYEAFSQTRFPTSKEFSISILSQISY